MVGTSASAQHLQTPKHKNNNQKQKKGARSTVNLRQMVDEEVAAVGAADGAADARQGDGGGGRVQLRGPRPAPHLRLRHQPTWTRFLRQMYL